MTLYIDSTDNKKVVVKLDHQEFTNEVGSPRDQDVFGFILECLNKAGFRQEDITSIEVNPGPGSFTGTRIGVTIGNTLAFALKIKINGQNPPVDAIYSAPPSITVPRA